MLLEVMKFGGSSVADYAAMRRCAMIIKASPKPVLVVVSALAGVTRKLMILSYPQTTKAEKQSIIEDIHTRHNAVLDQLKDTNIKIKLTELNTQLQDLSEMLAKEPIPQILDELLSLGERMSSLLFTAVMLQEGIDAELFDVRLVMRTTSTYGKAEPVLPKIKKLCAERLKPLLKNKVTITQGFIGSDAEGHTTILGKESSDYTAALLAEALDADHFKIWTDVAGVFSVDPKLYPQAKPITQLSFGEALELTTFGAKVLHARTLEPAIRGDMQCYVGSSIAPQGGTWIKAEIKDTTPQVKAISIKKDQVLLRIERGFKTSNLNFLETFLEILNKHQIEFDLLSNHGLSTTLVLDDSLKNWHQKSLLSEDLLDELKYLGKINLSQGLTLLALTGQNIPQCPKIKNILTETLKDLRVDAFYYGASPYSLCILTELKDEKIIPTVARLHQQLIEG